MLYSDGQEALLGDTVAIATVHRGLVVACLDQAQFSAAYPKGQWAYLKSGLLVETDFGGLIHYPSLDGENIELLARVE